MVPSAVALQPEVLCFLIIGILCTLYNSYTDDPFACVYNSWLNTNMMEGNIILRVTDLDGYEKVKFLQMRISIS